MIALPESFALDPLLLTSLGEPFGCLCDRAGVQFRDDLLRAFGVSCGVARSQFNSPAYE